MNEEVSALMETYEVVDENKNIAYLHAVDETVVETTVETAEETEEETTAETEK